MSVIIYLYLYYVDIDRPKEKCFKYVHDTRVQRIETFGAALSVQDWGHIMKQNDVNKRCEGFVNIFNELYDIHYTLKKGLH